MSTNVEICNLTKKFGAYTAVDDISFSVDKGSVLGFLGPNGAGKSTTMKMITGFMAADKGTATICGYNIASDPLAAKKMIGYLPEGAPAYPDMTTISFLKFIADIRGISNRSKAIENIVDKVNIREVLRKPIDTLSKGFKRRVGLAQALIHDPRVLILDEPTDGLDPNQKYEVRELIREMAKEKVIILSTHILEEVDAVCTRAIIIAEGKILADDTPEGMMAGVDYHNSVKITIASEEDWATTLESIDNVSKVTEISRNDTHVCYQVFPNADASIISKISHVAKQQNWDIVELHTEKGRMDDVFRNITLTQST